MLLLLTACQPTPQDLAQAEVIQARAEAARIANEYQAQLNQQDLALRATSAAVELQARVQVIDAQGKAQARAIEVGGIGLAAILGAIALAVVILAVGWSVAHSRQAVIASGYMRVGVEGATLLPPLLITADGYLYDPNTGERTKIRDAAGVDHLRLAAASQTRNIALGTRAAVQIARHGRHGDSEPAGYLPGIVGGVPLIEGGKKEE